MICPYSFDEPDGSGIPVLLDGRYWCMGHIALGMVPAPTRLLQPVMDTDVESAPCGLDDTAACRFCADDCPLADHKKTCRGGCSPCTCGGHDE